MSIRRVDPPSLRRGDRVAVVAPSGPIDPAGLERGCARLRALGLEVIVGRHIRNRHGFLAAPDADRAADFHEAWGDPRVRAVLCARGGYGATRMLDGLEWSALRDAGPKLLHGSSDATALHVAFGQQLGLTTSFGPMVAAALGPEHILPETLASLRAGLFAGSHPALIAVPGARALVSGRARGVLRGGTLSLLVSLLGTSWAPGPAEGGIVLIEDVREAPYRIDRMLTQLLQAGWFEGVAGIVLGSWMQCGDPQELEAVLIDRLAPLGVPMLAGLPIGHGTLQLTVRLGAVVDLDADAGTLTQHHQTRQPDQLLETMRRCDRHCSAVSCFGRDPQFETFRVGVPASLEPG